VRILTSQQGCQAKNPLPRLAFLCLWISAVGDEHSVPSPGLHTVPVVRKEPRVGSNQSPKQHHHHVSQWGRSRAASAARRARASSGDDGDLDDDDDDDRRADLLSESFTIADTGSVYSSSNFDDDFTAGTYCMSSSSSLLSAAVV
jgi:hypothetical protein